MLTAKPTRKVVVFRTAPDRKEWIGSELLAGRLRQGWGIPGSELTENNVLIPFGTWSKSYAPNAERLWSAWNWRPDEGMKRRYAILARMIDLRRGDLVIVPKVPSESEFTIAQITRGYHFDDKHFYAPVPGAPMMEDFGHVLQVDPARLVGRAYGSSPEAKTIAEKVGIYRAAVNNVQDTDLANQICAFFDRATQTA